MQQSARVWTLRVQAHVRLIVWYLPFGEPHGFAGYRDAAIGLSPLRRHFVPPKVAQVPIPPKWRGSTAPRRPFPIGASVAAEAARAGEARDGSSVPVAGATIPIR